MMAVELQAASGRRGRILEDNQYDKTTQLGVYIQDRAFLERGWSLEQCCQGSWSLGWLHPQQWLLFAKPSLTLVKELEFLIQWPIDVGSDVTVCRNGSECSSRGSVSTKQRSYRSFQQTRLQHRSDYRCRWILPNSRTAPIGSCITESE